MTTATKTLKIFWSLNLLLVLFLLVFYVFWVCSLTREIYLIKNHEKKLQGLLKENKILEINLSKTNSLSNVENYLLKGNFVKANQIKYIPILETSVANK